MLIKQNPKDEIAYGIRRGGWSNKGEYNKAIADLNKAIRLDPDESGVTAVVVLLGAERATTTELSLITTRQFDWTQRKVLLQQSW